MIALSTSAAAFKSVSSSSSATRLLLLPLCRLRAQINSSAYCACCKRKKLLFSTRTPTAAAFPSSLFRIRSVLSTTLGEQERRSFLLSSSQQQQQQTTIIRRWISKKRKKQYALMEGLDPFAILGCVSNSKDTPYATVKRNFLQIAMKHHPDTTSASATPEERQASKDTFVAARKAFEEIVVGPNGMAILKSESPDHADEEDEDLDTWFKNETGHDMPFMDAQTMKEVAETIETVGGGLDRDGGMWTLARMVSNSVKSGSDGRDVLQIEAGSVRDRQINGILRRRRKR